MSNIKLRILIIEPVAGVVAEVPLGKAGFCEGVLRDSVLRFDFEVRAEPEAGGTVRFLGPATQGTPQDRFIYVNYRYPYGPRGTCFRRAKVKLASIGPSEAAAAEVGSGCVLVARFAGAAKDGGPACASVPLIGGGWALERL